MTEKPVSILQSRFHNYRLDKKAIPMVQVMGLVHSLEARGFPAEVSLANTGIDPDHTDRVSYRQRIAQLENMLKLIGADGHWLDSPRSVSISDYGLLGYAMMSSATLEQAVQIAVKYHRMAGAMFELTFDLDGDEAVLRIEHLLPGGEVGQFVVEEIFSGVAGLIGLLLGEDHVPSRIMLNYEPTTYADKYEGCFGCDVEFGQSTVSRWLIWTSRSPRQMPTLPGSARSRVESCSTRWRLKKILFPAYATCCSARRESSRNSISLQRSCLWVPER